MLIALLAFITGILVGLTGTGAGVILTPLLLLLTPFSALTVIGTDLMSGALTKLVGVVEHRKLGQVRWNMAGYLLAGSIPGSVGGILFIHYLKSWMSEAQLDHALKILLGLTLFGVSFFLPFLRGRQQAVHSGFADFNLSDGGFKLIPVGAIVGFLVSMTSVGSGSLLMIALLVLVPLPLGSLVGTDILFGLVTTALAGSLHMEMGNFNANLFLLLVAGEVPGVIIGSRLTRRIPERYITWLFSILYFSLGARLLIG
ncbi:MAG: sulfite exporter TauE/SafE family protein [Acidobacteria bacterium]|nr:MAG: sulfite exporter TauE/SafE family protein [Acidobacteriota bacterium]